MSTEIRSADPGQPDPLADFLEGHDFMRLGQAIHRGQWDSAMMILRRMDASVKNLGLGSMEQPLKGLRLAVMNRNMPQAKQILASLITKRVGLLRQLKTQELKNQE